MGNPKPVAVSGVTSGAPAARGVRRIMAAGRSPRAVDVEEFAGAFVRFENGATLMLEVSWMLHHNTHGEDTQIWLYGAHGGCHWPKGALYR